MSLRAFHVFFIVLCILLTGLVGGWGLREYMNGAGAGALWLSGVFLVGGVALVVYGVRFFKKLSALR